MGRNKKAEPVQEYPVFEATMGDDVIKFALVLPKIEVPGKGIFTAQQLLLPENEEVLAGLVAIQSGMLQKLEVIKKAAAKSRQNKGGNE